MSQRTFLILSSVVLATITSASAKIHSCVDVGCPITAGTTATCTVVDKSFSAVGVAGIDSSVDSLKGLSWVKAVGGERQGANDVLDQAFYLGTPDGFEFGATGACALFFTQVSDMVRFGDLDPKGTEGVCSDAMTNACISALTDRAKKVDLKGLSGTAACAKLQKDFSDNLDSACAAFAQASKWAGIEAKALSGTGAPTPISAQQNSTSTCWPVLPKADDLTLVDSSNSTGNFEAAAIVKKFFSITPILTVFFPGDGNGSLVSQPEAQLTCVKAVDLTTASNATLNRSDKGNDAGRVVGGAAAMWAGLVTVALAALMA